MATQTNQKRTSRTAHSSGGTKRVSPTRRAHLKGTKGGESTTNTGTVNKIQKEVQKQAPQVFQKYADQTLKVAHKMGLKGGAAVMAGGAAGVVLGAALGGLAAAAMSNMRTARMASNTRDAAESIKRHAEDLKKMTGSKQNHTEK